MICLVCNKGSIDGLTHPVCKSKYAIDGAFCAVAYKGIVKKLIYNFKYKPYLADLRNILVELFYESIIQQEIFQKAFKFSPILVPIPLSTKRLRKRGYNHSKLLAEGLSKSLNLKLVEALQRTKDTKSQFGLKLKDIATLLGRADHTTVMHGVEKIARSLKSDKNLCGVVGKIRSSVHTEN